MAFSTLTVYQFLSKCFPPVKSQFTAGCGLVVAANYYWDFLNGYLVGGSQMVECESCFEWFHKDCVEDFPDSEKNKMDL